MRTKVIQTASKTRDSRVKVSDSVVQTIGLAKSFGSIQALRGIDVTVPKNSIVGFLGPNGSGKTTAIKLLLGLSRPTAGQALVFGLDSVADSLAIRARIGYLAQDPRFYPHMTARETLEFTARFFYAGPAVAIRQRINDTLDLVGLADKADRPTKGFSGGERQRLGIAQAQINNPDLLILDEPAAALDPLGRRDVLEVMERLRPYTTIFYSTHILDDVQRVSDYVAILDQGRVVANASTRELLDGDTTTYELAFRGNEQDVRAKLGGQSWVSDIVATGQNGLHSLTVTVTDQAAAEERLLRSVLAGSDVAITDFHRKQHNLEEVFLHLVKGQQI